MEKIPTNTSNFKELIRNNCYYVDKTKLIEDLIECGKDTILFPRPRRFGKTLTMSMLDNFFNVEKYEENKDLFKGLYIENSKYYNLRGTIPVISISFKDVEENNINSFYNSVIELIIKLYEQFEDVLYDNLSNSQKQFYDLIIYRKASIEQYKVAIANLMKFLKDKYNSNVLLLIDEYDVPIQNAYTKTKDLEEENSFYNQVVSFLKTIFSSCAKDNNDLYKAIFTGVLCVSQESIFSGLNNFEVYGLLNSPIEESFGFTESETKELLEYYNLELNSEVKRMYNGYIFNNVAIYNPWSILKYAYRKVLDPYWINSSRNSLIKEMLKNTTKENKVILEKLIQGISIPFIYDENITFKDISNHNDLNAILNMLFASGYLTFAKQEETIDGIKTYIKIPNKEVNMLITKIMQDDIFKDVPSTYPAAIIEAVNNYDIEKLEQLINDILQSSSYMDTKEMFYHGFVLAMFSTCLNNKNYIIKSNREAGSGRYDILLERVDKTYGYIFEFKLANEDENMESISKKALKQIENKEYYQELILDKVKDIRKVSIVFKDKKCLIRGNTTKLSD